MLQVLLALSLRAFAQAPAPAAAPAPAPAVSTDTVQSSSATAPAVAPTAPAVAPTAPTPPAPAHKPVQPIQVRIHPDARDWEPVSLTAGSEPEKASTHFSRRLKRHVTKKATAAAATGDSEASASVESEKLVVTYKGESSRAASAARVHPAGGEDKMLIVSVYPKSLAPLRKHLEARFLIQEGYLEEVKVAAVTISPGPGVKQEDEDSYTLEKKGVAFSEDFPASAKAWVAAISLKPGNLEAGGVERADFVNDDLRLTSFGWNVKLKR